MANALLTFLVLVLPVLLVATLFWAALNPGATTLALDEDVLHIELHKGDVFVALRRRITLPRDQIEGVAVAPVVALPRDAIRIAGTGFAGIKAGIFGSRGMRNLRPRDFWMLRRATEVLVVEMKPEWAIRRYILELPDPRAEALRLRPELGAFLDSFTLGDG